MTRVPQEPAMRFGFLMNPGLEEPDPVGPREIAVRRSCDPSPLARGLEPA